MRISRFYNVPGPLPLYRTASNGKLGGGLGTRLDKQVLQFGGVYAFLFSGSTTRRFVGHTKDVMSVAFSADNRQIVSGSRDHTIKLWNTLGVCKYTIQVR